MNRFFVGRASRSELERMVTDLERERDLAVGRERNQRERVASYLEQAADAHDLAVGRERNQRERVASYLEQAADAHDLDAHHLAGTSVGASATLDAPGHRAVATRLRDLARDVIDPTPTGRAL